MIDPISPQDISDVFSLEILSRQAIDAALNCQWEKAAEINEQILKELPENIETLNRLAKANFELGKYLLAKKYYQQVLDLDPYNTIADRNLKKISSFKKNSDVEYHSNGSNMTMSAMMFVEEPGITKLVNLVKLAEPQKLLTLSSGNLLNLVPKKRGISVTDFNNQYLGVFPDDSAYHLSRLITGGNKYQVIVKSVKPNGLTVLVREVYRSKKFKNQASFLDESKILALSSDNISLGDDNDSPDDGETEEVV